MGFNDEGAILAALRACRGSVEAAADMLASQPNLLDDGQALEDEEVDEEVDERKQPDLGLQETEEQRLQREREQEIKDAAKNDLVNALAQSGRRDNDEEFDLNLDEEMAVLMHYKQLMIQK